MCGCGYYHCKGSEEKEVRKMKKIFSPMLEAEKICGEQKIKSGTKYRPTRHCISVPCEDGTLLYHTLTGALYLLESNETAEDHKEELIRARYYVPEDFDEIKYARDVRNVAAMLRPKPKHRTAFTILTTTDCNARCFYCYEMGCKRMAMSPQTAHDTADYIARVCGGERVDIQWFGGEPLYNRKAIEIITSSLREKGIEFSSKMVSNGYLLDEETAKQAKESWNITWIQISLDGTKNVYNRTKAYIENDEDAFERVLKNIEFALDAGITVHVRLNMDSNNADDLSELVDILAERFEKRKGFYVYVALLRNFGGKVAAFDSEEKAAGTRNSLQKKINGYWGVYSNNLPTKFRVHYCQADNDACEVIMPDGNLEKCEHFVEGEYIGSIYNDKRDKEIICSWKETDFFPACKECALFPQCIFLKRCESSGVECKESRRAVMKFQLEERLLHDYRVEKSKQSSTMNNKTNR